MTNHKDKTVVEVDDNGLLRLADFGEPETRDQLYESLGSWSVSPLDLVEAMEGNEPFRWAANQIYDDFRDSIEDEILKKGGVKRRIKALAKRLKQFPDDAYDGAVDWILGMTDQEFETLIVPGLNQWFSDAPDYEIELDYLPLNVTAQGAALQLFSDIPASQCEALGVVIIEGECPGSSYFAAELRIDAEEANKVADKLGLSIYFRLCSGY
jgi:hypothetical protein